MTANISRKWFSNACSEVSFDYHASTPPDYFECKYWITQRNSFVWAYRQFYEYLHSNLSKPNQARKCLYLYYRAHVPCSKCALPFAMSQSSSTPLALQIIPFEQLDALFAGAQSSTPILLSKIMLRESKNYSQLAKSKIKKETKVMCLCDVTVGPIIAIIYLFSCSLSARGIVCQAVGAVHRSRDVWL